MSLNTNGRAKGSVCDNFDEGSNRLSVIRADDGHQIFHYIFTAAETRDVLEGLSRAALDRTKAGARHVLGVPVVRQLADDSRLIGLARQFVGEGATPFRATLFDKSPTANWLVTWHQDTALPLRKRFDAEDWGPWSRKAGVLYAHAPAWVLEHVIALRVSLDNSSADNGPLRVVPHTHRLGVLTPGQINEVVEQRQPVDCTSASGGVVAMRPLTVHASSKATSGELRRVLHIEYASVLDLGADIQLATA
jgi:hypothetical protein